MHRNLLEGLPDHNALLRAQQLNLRRFVQEHADEFARMPYEPFTVEPPTLPLRTECRIAPATYVPGLLGVFLKETVRTKARRKPLLYYQGLLVTEPLLKQFQEEYHCPTALGVPALDYVDESSGKLMPVSIIGDPTQPAAIVNDGAVGQPSDERVNCKLLSILPEKLSSVLLPSPTNPNKQLVTAQVAVLYAAEHQMITPSTELLVSYGPSFWQPVPDYCARCFSCICDHNNPLVQCSGTVRIDGLAEQCTVSRHRMCFDHPPSLFGLGRICNVQYFCADHLPAEAPLSVCAALASPMAPALTQRSTVGRCQLSPGMVLLRMPKPWPREPPTFSPHPHAQPSPPPTAASTKRTLQSAFDTCTESDRHVTESVLYSTDPVSDLVLAPPHPLQPRALDVLKGEETAAQTAMMRIQQHHWRMRYADQQPPRVYVSDAGEMSEEWMSWMESARSHELRASRVVVQRKYKPTQLGLFATRRIEDGEDIDFYGGLLTFKDTIDKSKLFNTAYTHNAVLRESAYVLDGWPLASVASRYIAHTDNGLRQQHLLPPAAFIPTDAPTPQHLQVQALFRGCARGFFANSAKHTACTFNVKIVPLPLHPYRDHAECATDVKLLQQCFGITKLPILRASRVIEKGDELLVEKYNSNEERHAWQESHVDDEEDARMEESSSTEPEPAECMPADAVWQEEDAADADSSTQSDASTSDDEAERPPASARRVTAPRPPSSVVVLRVRKPSAAKKLALFGRFYNPLSRANNQLLLDRLRALAQLAPAPWYASSLKSLTVPADGVAAAGAPDKYHTRARWAGIDALVFDLAEMKACPDGCGMRVSSIFDAMSLLEERINLRKQHTTEAAFNVWMRDAIFKHGTNNEVQYLGASLCHSCFRAMTGVGACRLHSVRGSMSTAHHAQLADMARVVTPAGRLHKARSQPVMSWLVPAVLKLMNDVGQHPPNPRGSPDAPAVVVMPYSTVDSMRQQLQVVTGNKVSSSSLGDARMQIQKLHHQVVAIRQRKEMCRCSHCDKNDQEVTKAKFAVQQEEKRCKQHLTWGEPDAALIKAKKWLLAKTMEQQRHWDEASEQRRLFDEHKLVALTEWGKRMCIAIDGMDQAKTRLPHLTRYPKNLDTLLRLGVHVVGAICLGGSVPIMGLLNFEDVKKDSSLSISMLHTVLEAQFQKLLELDTAAQAAPSAVQPAGAEAAAAADVTTAAPARLKSAFDAWPPHLHVTFDNATGECKNQWMFRYLGLLVLHGVFQCVTVTTLLVGHTHDLVDQMFSVWSRLLNVTNVETVSKMQALFRERYTSRIAALRTLMNGGPLSAAQADECGFSSEEARGMQEARNEQVAAAPAAQLPQQLPWTQSAAEGLERFSAELDSMKGASARVEPSIVQQQQSIDVQTWMEAMPLHDRKGAESISTVYPLPNVSVPHVFGIEKDKRTGDVYLYNRFLANSHRDPSVVHHWPNQQTGHYTTRALLWRRQDAQDSQSDPTCMPTLPMDTEALRHTIECYKDASRLSTEQYAEWLLLLDSFDQRLSSQGTACGGCSQLVDKIRNVGVVSRKKTQTKQEEEESKRKAAERIKLVNELRAHLLNTQHDGLVQAGWWTAWMDRVRDVIRPSYVRRGIVAAQELEHAPFMHSPSDLCRGRGEKPIMPERVPLHWFNTKAHRLPHKGDFVLCRMNNVREPFALAVVLCVYATRREGETARAVAAAADSQRASAAAAADDSAAAAGNFSDSAAAADLAEEGAAASDEEMHPFGVPHRMDRRRQEFALPYSLQVHWWDFRDGVKFTSKHDGKQKPRDLHLDPTKRADEQWWRARFHTHTAGWTEEQFRRQQEADPNAAPSRHWIVDRQLNHPFEPLKLSEGEPYGYIKGSQVIVWGDKELLLGSGDRLRKPVQRALRKDLTELDEDTHPIGDITDSDEAVHAPLAAAAAAAASAASGTPRRGGSKGKAKSARGRARSPSRDSDDEDDEHMLSSERHLHSAVVRAATAERPRARGSRPAARAAAQASAKASTAQLRSEMQDDTMQDDNAASSCSHSNTDDDDRDTAAAAASRRSKRAAAADPAGAAADLEDAVPLAQLRTTLSLAAAAAAAAPAVAAAPSSRRSRAALAQPKAAAAAAAAQASARAPSPSCAPATAPASTPTHANQPALKKARVK